MHRRSRQHGYLHRRTTDEGVSGCMVCLHVSVGVKGEWRPSFISYCDQIFYMI